MATLKDIQRKVGVTPDGVWGPNTANAIAAALGIAGFDRAKFLAQFVNTNAPAITDSDLAAAALRLGVTQKHLHMLRKVESGGKSFDDKGRPVILFEPHIFFKRLPWTGAETLFAYIKWGAKPYPKSYDGRWEQLADAAEHSEAAAIESASWGLWQIMGFHWKALGYASAHEFARSMVASEAGHLDALVRFIEKNGLAPKLRACRAGSPDSCRAFAKSFNGAGYERNKYHIKMAEALR